MRCSAWPDASSIAVQIRIEPFREARDSFEDLTHLLNAAYARLAEMGLNYVAATQDANVTRKRIAAATACWVARRGDELVGTICFYEGRRSELQPEWYGAKNVCHFAQFAVAPQQQGNGIGSLLLDIAERRATADGMSEFSCDTAEGAKHLIEYYLKRGFRVVGEHQWPHAVYRSVVLSKRLRVDV